MESQQSQNQDVINIPSDNRWIISSKKQQKRLEPQKSLKVSQISKFGPILEDRPTSHRKTVKAARIDDLFDVNKKSVELKKRKTEYAKRSPTEQIQKFVKIINGSDSGSSKSNQYNTGNTGQQESMVLSENKVISPKFVRARPSDIVAGNLEIQRINAQERLERHLIKALTTNYHNFLINFDEDKTSNFIHIENNQSSVWREGDGYRSTYSKMPMQKNPVGKSKFYYQVEMHQQNDPSAQICIGISNNEFQDFDDALNMYTHGSYCLECSTGDLIIEGKKKKFCQKIGPGSIVVVLFDFDKGTLDFIINGQLKNGYNSEKFKTGQFFPTLHLACHFDCVSLYYPKKNIYNNNKLNMLNKNKKQILKKKKFRAFSQDTEFVHYQTKLLDQSGSYQEQNSQYLNLDIVQSQMDQQGYASKENSFQESYNTITKQIMYGEPTNVNKACCCSKNQQCYIF